jgi:hypothetical protein
LRLLRQLELVAPQEEISLIVVGDELENLESAQEQIAIRDLGAL